MKRISQKRNSKRAIKRHGANTRARRIWIIEMKFLEMLGISVLVLALSLSFIFVVCFSLGALING
ncbi:hypothetical protein EC594_01665 [Helicobacter pylori]|nr:hypothetical protein EC594_01665 [Helicobacter pylori]